MADLIGKGVNEDGSSLLCVGKRDLINSTQDVHGRTMA